jgi:hypothetical protein
MIKKILLIAIIGAGAVAYFEIQDKGMDKAFDGRLEGIMEPVESVHVDDNGVVESFVTPMSVPGTAQTNYGKLVQRVRDKTNDAMDKGVDRSNR